MCYGVRAARLTRLAGHELSSIPSRRAGDRAMRRRWFAIPLWKRVLGGLVLGLLLALVWPEAAPKVAVFGDLFVRAIRMLVAPIVLVTIAAGIKIGRAHV